jgi:hypothetical protein
MGLSTVIMTEIIFPWVCVSNCNNCDATDGCLYHSLVDISDEERLALRSVMVQSKLNWCFVKCINRELSVQQSIVAMVLKRGLHSIYISFIQLVAETYIFVVCVRNKVHSSLCCATSGYLEISGDGSIDLLSLLVLQMKCYEIVSHHPSLVRP